MQIDRESVDKLLSLNDRQLKMIISRLAAESGIDPASFNINPSDISSIRQALSTATDKELQQVADMYEKNRKK